MEAVGYIHFLWSTVLQILVCVYLIFRVLGPSALAGLAFMIVRCGVGSIGVTYSGL